MSYKSDLREKTLSLFDSAIPDTVTSDLEALAHLSGFINALSDCLLKGICKLHDEVMASPVTDS